MANKAGKNVLLVTAPRPSVDETPLHFGDNRPPLGLGYVAAYLEKYGHRTKIIDLYHFGGGLLAANPGVTQEEPFNQLSIDLDSEIRSFQPDLIGMSIHTMSFYAASELAREFKKKYPAIPLICGGPHATVLPETIPSDFDHVIMGEGEYATLDVVEGRARDRFVPGIRPKNLDDLPWPDYGWFVDKPYNWKLGIFGHKDLEPVISLNTTRGCPFPCRFCVVCFASGRECRAISPDVLVEKIVELKERYGLKGVYFREDNFTTIGPRLERFCDLMIEKGMDLKWACESRVDNLSEPLIERMCRAGCRGLYIGVESGSPRMLEYMEKKEKVEDFLKKFPILHDHGIRTYTTWIFGLPTETREERHLSEMLLERLNPTSYDKFVYIGMPRSYFYDQLDENDDYEFKEPNGMIYPKGYLSLTQQLYGEDDPRCRYVERVYQENNVTPSCVRL